MIKAVKGTFDILPGDVETWQAIETVVREKMSLYRYEEIRVPVFEETSLFARSIGEDTDIVVKEMYTFSDMGGRSLTLRPEGTATVVRSFIEHSLDQQGLPRMLWYMGPMFRQERPQKGRQRQFHQFGVEVIGSPLPVVDADVMILFEDIASTLGLAEIRFSLNSLGGERSRKAYLARLMNFLAGVEDRLCDDCRRRMKTNPLRVLDCKVPGCRSAVHDSGNMPKSVDSLTAEDAAHFDTVRNYLAAADLVFEDDPFLVRGLDYYTGIVFEVNYRGLGAQSAIMGGGRYDNLIRELGGPDLPAVGFACGIERLILAMKAAGTEIRADELDVYIIDMSGCPERALRYLTLLRRSGISAVIGYLGRSMKAEMKTAAKYRAKRTLIIEPEDDKVSVRDMEKSEQTEMSFDKFFYMMKSSHSYEK